MMTHFLMSNFKMKVRKYMEERKLRSNFKYNIGENIISDSKNITILNRFAHRNENGRLQKTYQYKCNICGWNNGNIIESDLKKQKYCACCHGRIVVEGINDIPTTASWMVDYFQGGYDEAKKYTKCSGKSIIPKCPYCGKIHDKQVRIITLFRQGFGCECSSDRISYPEKFIMYFLKSNNIDFIYQLTKANVIWANKYKYDFYLTKYNMIIEVNGGQHYTNSNFKTTVEKQRKIDLIKREIALNNSIEKYIELDCSHSNVEFIKNSILKSNLFDILQIDINKVDWNQCDRFAQSNLVKEVCNYYKDVDKNTSNISNNFNLHLSTICRYLKKGERFGWCDYNSNVRKVEVFDKNGISMGIYNSAEYIVNNTDYGYNSHCIRNVCRGKYKTHNGYIFRYT